ncbi:MAG: hypothetical protein M3P08_16980 [Thermoproteota archaeon]|nr:hypothetical protein [Thermoproteota archaeon]
MKKSISNRQTIVLASVLSAALLFGVVLSVNGYHTQIADAKQSHHHTSGTSSSSSSPDTTPDTTTLATSAATTTNQRCNSIISQRSVRRL